MKKDTRISLLAGSMIAFFSWIISRNLFPDLSFLFRFVAGLFIIGGVVGCVRITEKIFSERAHYRQAIRFVIIGILNTVIDAGVLNACIFLSGIYQGPWFAVFKGISFIAALINSYLWNAYWTFGSAATDTRIAFRFIGVSAIGFILNVGVASLLVNTIPAPLGFSGATWGTVAALIAAGTNMIWNFFGYKLLVFIR